MIGVRGSGKACRERREAVQTFNSDGVEIAYLDEGAGEAVLLIHGFASNVATNWVDTELGEDADAGRLPRHRL